MRVTSPLSLLLLPLLSLSALAVPQNYQNDAYTQNYELGGTATTVTSTITVRALKDAPGDYVLPLDENAVSWQVIVGKQDVGARKPQVDSETGAKVLHIPAWLKAKDDQSAITFTQVLAYRSRPLPEEITQDEAQYMLFESNTTYPTTAYKTKRVNLKYRAPRKILSHSPAPKSHLPDDFTLKGFKLAGSTLTLGPFSNVPPTIDSSFKQSAINVHYDTEGPVLAMKSFKRYAEVGVWGGNLNIEDWITLFNAGPKLKGYFSRLNLQAARFRPTFPAQILREITYPLPHGASSPYYYDSIGNVSTSHFRPSPILTGRQLPAIIEIQPRFPLLGGWQFEFTVGWNLELKEWLRTLEGGKKVLAVPFLTGMKGVVVDDAELIVTLPEGAKDITVKAPFPVDGISHSIHKTYLDSTGRPRITIKKAFATEQQEQDIYIIYTYPFYAIFQKPAVVAFASAFAFTIYAITKRLDMRISPLVGGKQKVE